MTGGVSCPRAAPSLADRRALRQLPCRVSDGDRSCSRVRGRVLLLLARHRCAADVGNPAIAAISGRMPESVRRAC